jgi:23S rRNA (guanosine2251-2'-O)-methyltransferase
MRKLQNSELNRLSNDEFRTAEKASIYLVLDNIRSLNNIGSIFRTADAFRVAEIYLCGISGTPPHRDIHKTALGAEETVSWIYCENTEEAIKSLKAKGICIYALEQVENSIELHNFIPPLNNGIAIVLGNEIHGVSEQILPYIDGCIEIPQFGTKHSFNVSVSAGIAIYDIYHKLVQKK